MSDSIPRPTDAQRTYLHPKNLEVQYGVHRNNAFTRLLIMLLADQGRRIEAALASVEGVDVREGHIRDNSTPDELRDKLLGIGLKLAEVEAREKRFREALEWIDNAPLFATPQIKLHQRAAAALADKAAT